MKEKPDRREKRRGYTLLLSIVLVFCVFGAIVYAISQKISREQCEAQVREAGLWVLCLI